MEECRKELCPRCVIRDWCSHRLDQAANRQGSAMRELTYNGIEVTDVTEVEE